MFTIPDEILETMTCDECHKFLSAGPVKVYRNRRTKCGRCATENDDGVISLYGLMIEQGLFKCVNRFDGCRQILSCSEVLAHESNCRSKTHVCPICVETTNIPTFLMIKHFKEEHPDRLLEKSSFKVDASTPWTMTYLFRNKDDLFFINCESNFEEVVGLSLFFLGDHKPADKIQVKFTVRNINDFDRTEIRTQKCCRYNPMCFMGTPSIIPIVIDDQVFIEFELCYQVVAEFVQCPISSSTIEAVVAKHRECTSYLSPWREDAKKITRKVSLDLQHHPEFQINWDSLSLLRTVGQNKSKFVPFCFKCFAPTPLRQNYIEIEYDTYRVLCWLCEKYFETQKLKVKFVHNNKQFQSLSDFSVLYACIWNCGKSFPWHLIYNHEVYCCHQQDQQCPVPVCNYSGKLHSFGKHFEDVHPSNECSLYSRVAVGRPSSPCSVMIYLWVSHAFISLNFRWDGAQYHLTVGENVCGLLQPRALLFIDDWANFLAALTSKGTFTWKNEEWLFIKCYWRHWSEPRITQNEMKNNVDV